MATKGNRALQLRLTDVEWGRLRAGADAAGVTVQEWARRRIFGGEVSRGGYTPGSLEAKPTAPPALRTARQRTPRAPDSPAPGKCAHPIGRRIGDGCAQCGATVSAR